MTNLWRALALVWLGGIASPVLYDEAPTTDSVQSANVGMPCQESASATNESIEEKCPNPSNSTRQQEKAAQE